MITSGRYAYISTFVKSVQQGLLGTVEKHNIVTFICFFLNLYSSHNSDHLQVRPVDRCSHAVAQKTCNHSRMCLSGVRTSPPSKTRKTPILGYI